MNPGILWKYTSGIFEVYLKCNSFKKVKFTTNINKKVNRKKALNNFLKSENKELWYELKENLENLKKQATRLWKCIADNGTLK